MLSIPTMLLFAFFIAMFPFSLCFAYLDPGTGSYIFQMIMAAVIGGLYALKLFWNQMKLFFYQLFSRKTSSTELDSISKEASANDSSSSEET